MVILHQNAETGYWTEFRGGHLTHVHDPRDCQGRGCAIHNHPSAHKLRNAPLNWRGDRGILERICAHGVGHPDWDAAQYLVSIGRGYESVHGCDGCCLEVNTINPQFDEKGDK